MSRFNEYDQLKLVGIRSAENAFQDNQRLESQWQPLRFHSKPDLNRAIEEHNRFKEVLSAHGAELIELKDDERLTLDSIYTRDNIIVSPNGLILCNMGRESRTPEAEINMRSYAALGFEVAGQIEAPGTLEGGDFIWLDTNRAAVGLGPRTNREGVKQLHHFIGDHVELHVVPLPEPDHPDDVLHLMSIISPLDEDLAAVYMPLMPPEFLLWLQEMGISVVEIPESEYPLMGCNLLALAPRKVLMLENLPESTALLEAAGCEVITYAGLDISRKGEGGPTCLTRPLVRG